MPRLARITIYPIKSLDGVDVSEAVVLPTGALEHDRRFAIIDEDGEIVNAKRTDRFHTIRSSIDAGSRTIALGVEGRAERTTFGIDSDRPALLGWLGDHLGAPVRLIEDAAKGIPDDSDSPGPTVLSTATLEVVAGWFPGLAVVEARRRFRANLEIGGSEPFWEDRLLGEPGKVVLFRVGAVTLLGVNPCARCPVPSRSSVTGEPTPRFQKQFAERRRETLPPWAPASRFDHFYRLAVNTRPSTGQGGTIRVGDEVEIIA